MAFNTSIQRGDAQALIPEEFSRDIIDTIAQESAFMRMARRLPNMSRQQMRLPIIGSLPSAFFVTSTVPGVPDTGLKQTTTMAWTNKFIDAVEMGVVLPISRQVLDDTEYDLFAEAKPKIVEAFGAAIDAACFFGTSKPTEWPTDLLTASINAGTRVVAGSVGDLYDDIMGNGGLLNKLEKVGYSPTGHVAPPAFKGKLRGLRDAVGQPLFRSDAGPADGAALQAMTRYELDGAPVLFTGNGAFDPAVINMFAGDWTQVLYSIRQDMTYRVVTEGVISDNSGVVILNLPQQNSVALFVNMRWGWQVPNPINRLQQTESSRYPVAAYTP
jgi:HK97 family phage major capsid protein